MKHQSFAGRILCLILTLALLLNFAGCVTPPDPTTQATVPTTQSPTTVPTTVPTEPTVPPTTVPTEPTEPTPPADANKLEYTLTQADIDEFYRLLDETEKMAIAGEDLDAIDAISDQLDEQFELLDAQNSIAMILYYANMEDKALTQQHLDAVDIRTAAADAYTQSVRRIYQSGTPARDMLFEDWTEQDIEMLLKYDERIAQLQKRNAEIEVAYRASSQDDVIIPLYIELVRNNNEIAKIYGYDNYYTYAYEVVYERDYAPEKVEQMRNFAKTHLPASFSGASSRFDKSFGKLDAAGQTKVINFLYNDYNRLNTDYVGEYLKVMPGNLKEHTQHMLGYDSMFVVTNAAMAGAFTTMIGDRSYCYFGPEYGNSCTVIHEAGHYYASRYSDLGDIPLDLAEVHSQANEWLFLTHVATLMDSKHYTAMASYQMYNSLAMILICLMVDEFEQIVYSTDISKFDAADFDAIMNQVCSGYFDVEFFKNNVTDVNAYWRAVVVEQPVYYISYAVSSIAALDLYGIAREDFAAAAEIYRKLCEEPMEDGGFLESISNVGLSGPFDEDFYIMLKELVKKSY
jgi:hypothetical protein